MKKKTGEVSMLKYQIYTPSQSPLRLGNEQLIVEKMEQLGIQGNVFVTSLELEEGKLKEPPIPSMELIVANFKGKELDPMIEQASHKFFLDDSFLKSRALF